LIPRQNRSTEPNAAGDEVLVLFTSGTTGNKKLVPHCMGDMLIAASANHGAEVHLQYVRYTVYSIRD
jgi:acyl-coenzyme A synthetase/AMP-(fatty) acid ligase